MASVAFDTLKFATTLREKAKMSQEQAEGMAFAMADALQEGLATKSDLDAARVTLQSDLAATQARLQSDLAATETRLQSDLAATKTRLQSDLAATEARLQSDLAATEARLQHQIEETKFQIEASRADLLKWMFGTIGFQTLVLLGAVLGISRMAHP